MHLNCSLEYQHQKINAVCHFALAALTQVRNNTLKLHVFVCIFLLPPAEQWRWWQPIWRGGRGLRQQRQRTCAGPISGLESPREVDFLGLLLQVTMHGLTTQSCYKSSHAETCVVVLIPLSRYSTLLKCVVPVPSQCVGLITSVSELPELFT